MSSFHSSASCRPRSASCRPRFYFYLIFIVHICTNWFLYAINELRERLPLNDVTACHVD
ncbi:hypothetical protein T4C_13251 [Trichinella pseudospiralis]|uniref:Uncharacterized protein n=1 Tax=Trichinella pseudospiralis TaxID=6337 RepID=A0A0V1GN42_TRIPS|nr:hypothetical protein T4C_13251 [Trichinella pseudospiralis]